MQTRKAQLGAVFWLIAGLAWLAFAGFAEARQNYPFTLESERQNHSDQLFANNRGYAPVTVFIGVKDADNARTVPPLPQYFVIRPRQRTPVAIISSIDPSRGRRFTAQIRYRTGSLHAAHDPAAYYRLPFADGLSFVISQAAGDPVTTHTGPDSADAIDITMPEGSPIVAARDGTVIETDGSNQHGGKDRDLMGMANHVRILHADDTIATYAHLAPQGVLVEAGQTVRAGQPIGRAGSTGYSSGPHLHFVVQRVVARDGELAYQSIPFQLQVGNPPYTFVPRLGQKVTADYSTPGRPPTLVRVRQSAP